MPSRNPATLIIGMDEAGRGPWAGPVVAACVMLPPRFPTRLLKDSKLLSALQREKAFKKIISVCQYGVGVIDNTVIDQIGIKKATEKAMQQALDQLLGGMNHGKEESTKNTPYETRIKSKNEGVEEEKKNNYKSPLERGGLRSKPGCVLESTDNNLPLSLLVDGNDKFSFQIPHESIIKGDQKIKAISAASIIAKVWRDRLMHEYHAIYSSYGFDRHKGYGTRMHEEALKKHGICPIHRISYKPVQLIAQTVSV